MNNLNRFECLPLVEFKYVNWTNELSFKFLNQEQCIENVCKPEAALFYVCKFNHYSYRRSKFKE